MYHSNKKISFRFFSNIGLTICLVLSVLLSTLPQGITQADNSTEVISGQMGATKIQGTQPQLTYPENGWIDQNLTREEAPGRSNQPTGYHQYPSSTYQSFSLTNHVGSDGMTLEEIKALTQQTADKPVNRDTSAEVSEVNFWLNLGRDDWMWGIAEQDSTLTIEINSLVVATVGVESNGEWDLQDPVEVNPGDIVTVSAGAGTQPVTFTVPNPLTAEADTKNDIVSGQVGGRNQDWLQVHGWWDDGFAETTTEADGSFSINYNTEFGVDIPHGGDGYIHFIDWYNDDVTEVRYHQYFRGYSDEPILNIHYDHDWIDGLYKPGHTVYLEVKDGLGNLKAHITVESQVFEDGWSGFVSYQEGKSWSPRHPDIQPGDTIYAKVDDGEFTASVKVGEITAVTDLDTDIVTGTVAANWLLPGPIDVGCYIWEDNGPNVYTTVVPDGMDTYTCDFSSEGWDLQPGTNLMVAYIEPDGHQVIGDFHPPAPYLRVQNWFIGDGSPGVGANAAFYVEYANHGELPAENVTITDTLVGMTYIRDTSGFTPPVVGNELTWDVGTLDPGDWIGFVLFVEVVVPFDSPISNTVEITTTGPDMGDPGEKISTWEGTVAANDTHLNVGKWPWTWNPAPGEDFVYTVNVCNNGSTSSSTVDLTDTLPANTTFSDWWGWDVGWYETGQSGQTLELSHTCISPQTCSEVYIRVTVYPGAEPGHEIFNEVEIAADNDIETDDNWASVTHHVGTPYTDLSIGQYWHWGSLVPGGYYRYGVHFRNEGNLPVSGPIELTITKPEGTIFTGWQSWSWVSIDGPQEVGNVLTWQVDGLDPGFDGTIEVWLDIKPDTSPGTLLTHLAEIDTQPGESYTDNNTSIMEEHVYDHGLNLRVNKRGEWHSNETEKYAWYEVRVENIGDQTVSDVAFSDEFPEGMTLRDGPHVNFWEGFNCDDDADGFTCILDRLEPGWNMNVYYTLTPDTPDPGIIYTNTVMVGTIERSDVNPDDNLATAVLFSGPNMFIEKTLVERSFQPGTEVTYLLHFGNAQTAWWWGMQGNAIITDLLPEGMTFVSAYLRWCDQEEWCELDPEIDGQELTWDLYPFGSENWNEILLTVQIDEAVDQNNPLINQATIASDQPSVDIDPYPDNNSDIYDPKLIGTFYIFLPLIFR